MDLRDVCNLRTEPADPTAEPGACYVGLEHIDSGSPRLTRFGTAAEVTSSKWRFHPGDVLYGKLRPYLDKAVLADREGICSTDIIVLRANDGFDPEYLVNLVHTNAFVDHAVRTTAGVNHPRTNWSALAEFSIPFLPSASEQRASTRVLRAVQDATEARRRELDLERERKAALLEHLFTHGTWETSDRAIETPFGRVPTSWNILPLDDCAEVQTGVTLGRKLGDVETVECPYLRVANVQQGHLDLREVKRILLRKDEVSRYLLKDGDVLMTEGGDFDKLGRGFIWRGEVRGAVHQNHIFAVRVDRMRLLPELFSYLIQSPFGRRYFLSVAHKTTNLASINSSKLKRLPVPVPPLEEQREIAAILAACDAKITALAREIALYDELFRGLLEELMSGRLSVSPLLEGAAA